MDEVRIKCIPSEILVMIWGFMDVDSIVQASQVCTLWRRLILESDAVWKEAFSHRFSTNSLEFSRISSISNTYKEELHIRIELLRYYKKSQGKKLIYKVPPIGIITDTYADFKSHRLLCHSAIEGVAVLSDPTVGKCDSSGIFTSYLKYIQSYAHAREKPFQLRNLLSYFDGSRFAFAYPSPQDASIVNINIISKNARVLYTTISHPFGVSSIWITKSSDPTRYRHIGSAIPGNMGLITGDLSGRVWIWNTSTNPSRVAAYHLMEPSVKSNEQQQQLPIIAIYADSRYRWALVVNSAGSIFASSPYENLTTDETNSFTRFPFSGRGEFLGLIPDFARQSFICVCQYSVERFQLDDDNKSIQVSGIFQMSNDNSMVTSFNSVGEPSKQDDELTIPGQGSRIFAICESNGIIKVWNMRSKNQVTEIIPLVKIRPKVIPISIGINSLVIASSGYDGSVEIYDIISGEFIRQVQKSFKHSDQINIQDNTEYSEILKHSRTTIVDSDSTKLRGISAIGHLVTFWDYGGDIETNNNSNKLGIGRRRAPIPSGQHSSRQEITRKQIQQDISSDFQAIKQGEIKQQQLQSKIDKLNGQLWDLTESEQFAYATMLSQEEKKEKEKEQQQQQEEEEEDDDLKIALALSMTEINDRGNDASSSRL